MNDNKDGPPGDEESINQELPAFCWNRRRWCGAVAVGMLLIAISIQFVLRSGLFAYLVGVPAVLAGLWLILKQFELDINRKPSDCRYGRTCDLLGGVLIMLLNLLLQRIDNVVL